MCVQSRAEAHHHGMQGMGLSPTDATCATCLTDKASPTSLSGDWVANEATWQSPHSTQGWGWGSKLHRALPNPAKTSPCAKALEGHAAQCTTKSRETFISGVKRGCRCDGGRERGCVVRIACQSVRQFCHVHLPTPQLVWESHALVLAYAMQILSR